MNINFEKSLALILKSEGGYVNHPSDPGGMTNLGVTKRVWEEWVGHEVTEQTMRDLTPAIVGPMYKAKYWDMVKGDNLPKGVDYAVFDLAVNSGPGKAAKTLQSVLGANPDGQIGPATLRTLEAADPRDVATKVCEARLAFLQGLATFATFGKGWTRRVAEVQAAAKDMTAQLELPL